jgi:V/A-type H+-transporting ATPase subunit K
MTKEKWTCMAIFIFQVVVAMFLVPRLISAADVVKGVTGTDSTGLAYIGAGLAVGLACIGSSYAVGRIGSAGIGAVTEKPELMGKTLVFLGLAEGIAIYGLIIAVMILNKF